MGMRFTARECREEAWARADDEDRWPWWRRSRRASRRRARRGRGVIAARAETGHRDALRDGHGDVRFLHLSGRFEMIARGRRAARAFMRPR